MSTMVMETTYLIVGGGISAVTCVETLSNLCSDEEKITVVSSSALVKAVTNISNLSVNLQSFDVVEKDPRYLEETFRNVKFINEEVVKLDCGARKVYTKKYEIQYEKLCICSGANPNIIDHHNEFVIGLRDTESVKSFQKKLSNARKIVIVGNGGIATELAYEIQDCEVIWAVKDSLIGSAFFDPGAAEFFLLNYNGDQRDDGPVCKRLKYHLGEGCESSSHFGSALGPDWSLKYSLTGQSKRKLTVKYNCIVDKILEAKQQEENRTDLDWPVYVALSNGDNVGCDLIVSATGVLPNSGPFLEGNKFDIGDDGGFEVNANLQTNIPNVFAAGDVCSSSWVNAKHWFQMRLWTQARQMGHYAAKSMVAERAGKEILMDFCFELFTHVTKFFNFRVILLGLYNGQKLPKEEIEFLVRVTKNKEFIKVVMQDGRMQGAVLIGDTDLEETFENLILNQTDLSIYGESLLDPDIDIEDYFD